jgi:hypothetical protein
MDASSRRFPMPIENQVYIPYQFIMIGKCSGWESVFEEVMDD